MKKQKILILLCVSAVIVAMTSCDKDRDNTVHAVTFNADGGIPAPVAQQVKAGKTAAEPAAIIIKFSTVEILLRP